MIYKLPEEYSAQLSVEENAKFYRDSEEVMAELYPMLFAKKNERYSAIHRDEGLVHADTKEDANEHEHKIYVPKDENENYCGNLADSKMFASICKNYPRMMRERGWDFDDLDITDWDRYKYDSDYRAERKVKAKQNGLSVNKYMKKKSAETAKEEADDVQTIIDYATNFVHEKKELDKEKEQFKDEKEQLKFETDYQMALNETHMNIIKGQFDTIREQQEAEKELLKTAKENLAKGQKKLLKDKIEFSVKKKEHEKREADFQIKEDAQDAQKKALDAEAEEQKSLIADGLKYRQMRGQRPTTTAYENQQQEESKIAERRRGYTPWDE